MSAPQPARKPLPRRRRWLQFSLRTLLVFVLLASVGMSWLAIWKQRPRKRWETVKALEALGGSVDYSRPEGATGPDWLRKLLEDKAYPRIKINMVWLACTPVKDDALVHIERLSELQDLNLNRTQITDAGLLHLKGLSQLQGLSLEDTHVTDAGLAHIEGLTQLRTLALTQTRITDAGMVHLARLTKLNFLCLVETQITDAGLQHLERLPQLKELSLDRTQVTDAGLMRLKGLPRLQRVTLTYTNVTEEGVRRLQQALPYCDLTNFISGQHAPEAGEPRRISE